MHALVTGAAGFVGSHLSRRLLAEGAVVRGVDAFTPYYSRAAKERHLVPVLDHPAFELVEADLATAPLAPLLAGIDVVFHLAGQPGVRASWGRSFDLYLRDNVLATQRLLEMATTQGLRKFVYASSSSVYGNAARLPTPETVLPQPVSPYGVTKLAAEHLCELYRSNNGVPCASLRLFTVYGPGQRPDMAFSRLVDAAITGEPFGLLGDGRQTRDFTHVDDVTHAMLACAASDWCGVANIGGGARTSLAEVIDLVETLAGPIRIQRLPAQRGDARDTAADVGVAHDGFGYEPRTTLAHGLAGMVAAARATHEALPDGAGSRLEPATQSS